MGFEVFLSFRGRDTRSGITSYLYDRLRINGIDTFLDDEKIRKGREIWPEIQGAIHGSKICIPIFSEDYAWSTWCLDEVAEMVDHAKSGLSTEIILPIFYKITPAQVKRQTRSYAEAFKKHEEDSVDLKEIQKWRAALKFCTSLNGYESDKIANGNEAELVRRIVTDIKRLLKKQYLHVPDILIEVEDYVEEVLGLLDCDPGIDDRRMVVLSGMGGIGKTTLATIVYNRLCDEFDACAFLRDVREKTERIGFKYLQTSLISQLNKESVNLKNEDEGINFIQGNFHDVKVLILLDDITDKSQLEHLGANPDFFGPGSRIIVTTRNRDIHKGRHVYEYEVEQMRPDIVLRLFSKHAFGLDHPRAPFVDLSKEIVKTTGGLPLAITVIGSYLCEEERELWEAKLDELRQMPDDEVMKKLMISYDALTPKQKHIFLDIACFFIGEDKEDAFCLWEDLKLNPVLRVKELQRKSLVWMLDDDTFYMHQQLRDMARAIVGQENNLQPERTSRWWTPPRSEWIAQSKEQREVQSITSMDFKRHPNLRFLHMKGAVISGNIKDCDQMGLKYLYWTKAPQRFAPTNFNPKNLVILNLSGSNIKRGWVGWKHFKGAANSLKVLHLWDCSEMTKTPDLSIFPRLERLVLAGCYKLTEIDPSVGHLCNLVSLRIVDSFSLMKLPKELSLLKNLRELILHYCPAVKVCVSGEFLQRLAVLSAPCCESSITPMALPGEGLKLSIEWLREFPLKEFPISLRRLKGVRQASPSYQRWSKIYPEAAKDDVVCMEEICQLQETEDYHQEIPLPVRPPCRFAILENNFLCFYCHSHALPNATMWALDAIILMWQMIMWFAITFCRIK